MVRLNAAWADLSFRLQNQTPFDIICKFCSVNNFEFCLKNCYKENRMFNVLSAASVFKTLTIIQSVIRKLRQRCHGLSLLEPFKCASITNA